MDTKLKDRLKKVRGTFNIIKKELVTPRYLQLRLESVNPIKIDSLAIGDIVKIRPAGEMKKHKHIYKQKPGLKNRFIITDIDLKNKSITVEILSAFENNPLFEKLMDEQTTVVRLKSKGEIEGRHSKHMHTHHGKCMHHVKIKKQHHPHHKGYSCCHHGEHKHAHHHFN